MRKLLRKMASMGKGGELRNILVWISSTAVLGRSAVTMKYSYLFRDMATNLFYSIYPS